MSEVNKKYKKRLPSFLSLIQPKGFDTDITYDVFVPAKEFKNNFDSLPEAEKTKYAFEYMVQSLATIAQSLNDVDYCTINNPDLESYVTRTIDRVNYVLGETSKEDVYKFVYENTTFHKNYKKQYKNFNNIEQLGRRMNKIFNTSLKYNENIPQNVIDVLWEGFLMYERCVKHEQYVEKYINVWLDPE